MTIHNFLRPATRGPLLKGDIVFHIAILEDGSWVPRRSGHAGLVARTKDSHAHGEVVVVYHMDDECVKKQGWGDGSAPQDQDGTLSSACADVVGTMQLDENQRDTIIDEAVRYVRDFADLDSAPRHQRARTTELVPAKAPAARRLFAFGQPNPRSHPNYPDEEGCYAFSCTSYVLHCYTRADLNLAQFDELPPLSGRSRQWYQRHDFYVPSEDVPRLRCGYLIRAFAAEPMQSPYRPTTAGWSDCHDEVVFSELIAAAREAGPGAS
jgi:hypothetical protein